MVFIEGVDKQGMVMKPTAAILSLLILIFSSGSLLAAASLEKCKETLEKFRVLGDVPDMMAQSYGYAVLPTIGKGGIGIGAGTEVGGNAGSELGAVGEVHGTL